MQQLQHQQQQQQPQPNPIITVTIPRDYRDVVTKFDKHPFPNELLRNGVTLNEFDNTIDEINKWLLKAETIDSTTIIEELIGCLTFFSIFLFYDDKYKKVINDKECINTSHHTRTCINIPLSFLQCIKRINEFIINQNETIYNPKGITWVNPMSNGMLKIDILVRPSNSEISSSSSNNTTPSTIPPSINVQNNNNINSNNNNNNNSNNNSNQSTPIPFKKLNLEEKEIQKPETIINVVTNNSIVDLSDDDDDDEDDENLAHNSNDNNDQGSSSNTGNINLNNANFSDSNNI